MPRKIPYPVNWQLMDETGLVSARDVTRDHAYAHVMRYFSINGAALVRGATKRRVTTTVQVQQLPDRCRMTAR